LVEETSKWRLQNSEEMDIWCAREGTFALLGDACHATLPYLYVPFLFLSLSVHFRNKLTFPQSLRSSNGPRRRLLSRPPPLPTSTPPLSPHQPPRPPRHPHPLRKHPQVPHHPHRQAILTLPPHLPYARRPTAKQNVIANSQNMIATPLRAIPINGGILSFRSGFGGMMSSRR